MQQMQETWIQSLGWEDSLETEMATYLTAVWICICLMANDAVHLSKYLSVTLFRLYWVFTAECGLSLVVLSRLLIVLASLEEHGF